MRFLHVVLGAVGVLAAFVAVGTAEAQELRAVYNGRFVQLQLEGSYPQYIVQRADSPGGEFETLEYNRTGCTSQCTYDDYAVHLDQFYMYRIIVELPGGEERFFGPTTYSLGAKVGLQLHILGTPNPVRDFTEISWVVPATIASTGEVPTVVTIHDPAGREVNRIWERSAPVGSYSVEWTGEDGRGRLLPTGTYFYRVQVGTTSEVGRLVLLRR